MKWCDIRRVMMLLLIMSITMCAFAAKVELKVSAPGGIIGEGEMFQIYITVSDIDEAPAKPSSVPGASVKYFAHRSSSSSFVSTNGHTSQTFTNTYAVTLKAEKRGKYSYGPITVGGVRSNSVSYNIVAPGQGGSQSQGQPSTGGNNMPDPTGGGSTGPTYIGKGNEQLFLRANISKTTAFEQEALVYTVKLYTTYNSIKFIGATDAPKFDGFVIEESANISDQLTMETYNGRNYATAVIARYIIFPQMPGKLKITGNKYTVSADAEEYYHDPFYATLTVRRPVQLHVTPNDLTVDVKPLPTPRPANFSGGVGHFSISSSLPSANAIAQQASSIAYTVRGDGNLKYINLPDLSNLYPPQIEVFTPVTDLNIKTGASNVSGSVKFDYSFMPLEQGVFEIPEVSLVYFNPSTGKYETSVAKGYKINVARGSESAKSQATMAFSSRLMKYDNKITKDHTPYVYGVLYWMLWFVLPTVILLVILFMYRKHLAEQSDLVALRSKKAAKMARRRLRKAAASMQAGKTSRFYDEMLKALWGYLGDKLKLPVSELNRANVYQHLADYGVPEESRDKTVKLIDDCEYSKYSPDTANADMSVVYEEGIETINSLEDGFRKRRKSGLAVDDDSKAEAPTEGIL